MTELGHLLWQESAPQSQGERVYFAFTPGVGLTDVDFHPIAERNWSVMTSPDPDAVAEVKIAPQTTLEQINAVIEQLSRRGRYRHIEILLHP